MATLTESDLAGHELPWLVNSETYRQTVDGIEQVTLTEYHAVRTGERNNYVATLPATKNGLNLASISDDKRGPLTVLHVTYGTQLTQLTSDGALSWYTSTGSSLVYHEKAKIENTEAATLAYCNACAVWKYGLEPQGVSLARTFEGSHIWAEASWAAGQTDPGAAEGEGSANALNFSSAPGSATITQAAHISIFVPDGVVDPDILKFAGLINLGQIVYGFNSSTNSYCWQRKQSNPYQTAGVISELADYDDSLATSCQFAGQTPNIPAKTFKLSVTVPYIKAGSKASVADIIATLGNVGEVTATAQAGGVSVPAPTIPLPDYSGGACVVETAWQFDGVTVNASTARRFVRSDSSPAFETSVTYNFSTLTRVRLNWEEPLIPEEQ